MNKKLSVVAILAVVGLIGLLGSVVAFAQSEAPTLAAGVAQARVQDQVQIQEPVATTVAPAGNGYGPSRGIAPNQGVLAGDRDEMHTAIAEVLGMTVEELNAALAEAKTLVVLAQEKGVDIAAIREAMATVRADSLEQAVADGSLTAEEAAWMQQRAGGPASGGIRGGGPGMGAGPHNGDAPGLGLVDETEMHAALAAALGITVEELEAAQAEGTPLVLIAQEAGVEMTVVREAMATVREAAINQAVADGLLSAEQAEWLLSRSAYGSGLGNGAGNGAGPGSGLGNGGNGAGMGRGGQRMGQSGRAADELPGTGSGNGQGYGRMQTP